MKHLTKDEKGKIFYFCFLPNRMDIIVLEIIRAVVILTRCIII